MSESFKFKYKDVKYEGQVETKFVCKVQGQDDTVGQTKEEVIALMIENIMQGASNDDC